MSFQISFVINCWRWINRMIQLFIYLLFIITITRSYEWRLALCSGSWRALNMKLIKVFRINRRVRAVIINYYWFVDAFKNWFKKHSTQISYSLYRYIEMRPINTHFTYYSGHYMRYRQLNIHLFYLFHSFVVVNHFRKNNSVISSISNYRLARL